MNEYQRNIINIIKSEEFMEYLKEESERTKKRIAERMKKQKIVPYIRIGNEEQLTKLDELYANGTITDEEYVNIRLRIGGEA